MTTIFGIKNCDTVKKALKWLDATSVNYVFRDFRKDGLEARDVKSWLQELGADTLVNKRSTSWKALSDEDKDNLNNEAELIRLILEAPTLIKRPLLLHNGSAYVGFKADQYSTIFSNN